MMFSCQLSQNPSLSDSVLTRLDSLSSLVGVELLVIEALLVAIFCLVF